MAHLYESSLACAPARADLPYLIPGGVWYYTEGFLRRKEDQELAGLRTMPA